MNDFRRAQIVTSLKILLILLTIAFVMLPIIDNLVVVNDDTAQESVVRNI